MTKDTTTSSSTTTPPADSSVPGMQSNNAGASTH
jgi:hypothetical protein